MELRSSLSILILSLTVGACSNAIPTVTQLFSSSGDLKFSPSFIMTSSWSSVELSGTCSSFVTGVDVSFDGTTWYSPQALDPNSTPSCVAGKFSITLSNSRAPLNSQTFATGHTTSVQFRSHSSIGADGFVSVDVKYSPSSTLSQEILAGTERQSGGAMAVNARLRNQMQVSASGGSYRMKAWIKK